jgi:hypothetical protein
LALSQTDQVQRLTELAAHALPKPAGWMEGWMFVFTAFSHVGSADQLN